MHSNVGFEILKFAIYSVQILTYSRCGKSIIVDTDASKEFRRKVKKLVTLMVITTITLTIPISDYQQYSKLEQNLLTQS